MWTFKAWGWGNHQKKTTKLEVNLHSWAKIQIFTTKWSTSVKAYILALLTPSFVEVFFFFFFFFSGLT